MKFMLVSVVTFFTASSAWADWQLQRKGNYHYFTDGASIALSTNQPNVYHFKIDRGNGQWEIFFPNGSGDYTVFYSTGRTLYRKLSANAPYEVFNCNLAEFNDYYKQQYQQQLQHVNADFAVYFITLYQEADILLRACKAMHGG